MAVRTRELPPVRVHWLATRFGRLAIAWEPADAGPRVRRLFLPRDRRSPRPWVNEVFPNGRVASCGEIAALARLIQCYLGGEPVRFALDIAALDDCPPFQRRVLLAEHAIPRARVSTYARIARRLGHPRGARPVGLCLAHNPFPILVPCHRAVRSDGSLGGFQGGLRMKRGLLEMEGIAFSRSGRVILVDQTHY